MIIDTFAILRQLLAVTMLAAGRLWCIIFFPSSFAPASNFEQLIILRISMMRYDFNITIQFYNHTSRTDNRCHSIPAGCSSSSLQLKSGSPIIWKPKRGRPLTNYRKPTPLHMQCILVQLWRGLTVVICGAAQDTRGAYSLDFGPCR